jgi:hypothetical protein
VLLASFGKSRTGAGCAISSDSGIRRSALSRGIAREEAVRTETAIVSAVWLVVSGDGGGCYLLSRV